MRIISNETEQAVKDIGDCTSIATKGLGVSLEPGPDME